jgi:hypothetical protein
MLELRNALSVHIKPDHRVLLGKFHGQRQAYIAQANYADQRAVSCHIVLAFRRYQ